MLGAPDGGHLAYGWLQARVIVTHDTDFLRLHASGIQHAGIIFSALQARTVGDMIRSIALIWEHLEPEDMRGHCEFI